jgi:hypothetical protein
MILPLIGDNNPKKHDWKATGLLCISERAIYLPLFVVLIFIFYRPQSNPTRPNT